MTIAQMQAHRAVLAGLLAETEASYANLSGRFAGAFPATETHLDACRAALRWALLLADAQIARCNE